MKKMIPGLAALMLAVGFSAFTIKPSAKTSDVVYNWFNASDNSYFTSTGSSASPNSCTAIGNDCIKGFQSDRIDPIYPGGTPTVTYAHN